MASILYLNNWSITSESLLLYKHKIYYIIILHIKEIM